MCNHSDWIAICVYCGEVLADTENERTVETGTDIKTIYLSQEALISEWLALSASAFDFWDNEADDIYNEASDDTP